MMAVTVAGFFARFQMWTLRVFSRRELPENQKPPGFPGGYLGGAKRDRTADLYNAIVALSQLSYGPKFRDGRVGPRRCVDNGGGGASQEGL